MGFNQHQPIDVFHPASGCQISANGCAPVSDSLLLQWGFCSFHSTLQAYSGQGSQII